MLRTPRIESSTTAGTGITRAHVLVNSQLSAAPPTEDGLVLPLMSRPNLRRVMGKRVVTADTSIVLVAALVFNGDDVLF